MHRILLRAAGSRRHDYSDLLRIQRRVVRNVAVVGEQHLQGVSAGRQFKMRLGLSEAVMKMVLVVGDFLVEGAGPTSTSK